MRNIFIQNINFAKYSNSENLEELVKDTYERLEVITESVLQNKQKAQEKQKKYFDKNLKKNEDISAGNNVLIYDNTHKRSKGASLKLRFMGPYRVELAKKDSFKVNVNGKLETQNRKDLWKGM